MNMKMTKIIGEKAFLKLRHLIKPLLGCLFCAVAQSPAGGAESGDSVVVVYNSRLAESKEVAEHYARKRNVPAGQVVGLDLPSTEAISRPDFKADLQRPLAKFLENKKLFIIRSEMVPATNGQPGKVYWRVKESKIRYAVLCYGVPSRITEDSDLRESGVEKLPEPLRRNSAAVDSELALLPMNDYKLPITGVLQNSFFASTDPQGFHPTNGVLMVARLDGPSAAVAKGLVDKAMESETVGLWGRAYFDLRGIKEGEYKFGDDFLRSGAEAARKLGWETLVDEDEKTFPAALPLSQMAIYGGWYDAQVSGPFAQSNVEFMPGAFAYHLHSFSAATIRDSTKNWVGPLLARGATTTIGFVDEPYLAGTLDVGVFLSRFLRGFSFGEAAYAAQSSLSWQTTVIGDPLYRPVDRSPQQLHERLLAESHKLIEWSHLAVVNLNLVKGSTIEEVTQYLNEVGTNSPVLMEKLGDVLTGQGKTWPAINAYAQALNLRPSPLQEIRLLLILGEKLEAAGKPQEAADMYRLIGKKAPNYPGLSEVQQRIAQLTGSSPVSSEPKK